MITATVRGSHHTTSYEKQMKGMWKLSWKEKDSWVIWYLSIKAGI